MKSGMNLIANNDVFVFNNQVYKKDDGAKMRSPNFRFTF